jgi:hypothetical protein
MRKAIVIVDVSYADVSLSMHWKESRAIPRSKNTSGGITMIERPRSERVVGNATHWAEAINRRDIEGFEKV